MSDDSSARIARNALITTVVAILMNPVSVGLGYYLNQILRKPHISIEYISDNYGEVSHTLDLKVVTALTAHTDLVGNLRDTLTRMANERTVEACVEWLKDNSSWEDRCIPVVREVATGISGALAVGAKGSFQNAAGRAPPANVLKSQMAALQALLDDLQRMDEHPDTERTGMVKFRVGVLNTGDADGIVKNRATLRVEGKELWLSTDLYTVAKSPSFQEIEFSIPDNDQDTAALATWKKLVRDRVESLFELTLNTGTGTVQKTSHLNK